MALVILEEEAVQSLLDKAVERGIEIGGRIVSAHFNLQKQETKEPDLLITQKEAASRLGLDVRTFKARYINNSSSNLKHTVEGRSRFYLRDIMHLKELSKNNS